MNDKRQYIESSIIISLFSQPVFYITHQCVCQQAQNGNIDNKLLVELFEFLHVN